MKNNAVQTIVDHTCRLHSLDSLRGIAAMMVAIGHSFIAIRINGIDMLWATPSWLIKPTGAFWAKLF